jgi:hypothetical protein
MPGVELVVELGMPVGKFVRELGMADTNFVMKLGRHGGTAVREADLPGENSVGECMWGRSFQVR